MSVDNQCANRTTCLAIATWVLMLTDCGRNTDGPIESQTFPNRSSPATSLGIDNLRFYVLSGAEDGQDGVGTWDNRKGGLFALYLDNDAEQALSLRGDEPRHLYDKALAGVSKDPTMTKLTVTSDTGCIVLVGRLPGDGRGPNASYITAITGITEFVLDDKRISILAHCEFSGPHHGFEPMPQAIYFVAILGYLSPGRYQATVQVKPRGKVYEQRKDLAAKLPRYPRMTMRFDVN